MIGTFGPVTFESSSEKVRTFAGLRREHAGRWGVHDVVNTQPKLEFIGAGLDEIEFDMTFNASLGIVPADEAGRVRSMARNGEYHTLMIGGIPQGRFAVKSVSDSWEHVSNNGVVMASTVTIKLQEYAG
jgi:hypothetical protein